MLSRVSPKKLDMASVVTRRQKAVARARADRATALWRRRKAFHKAVAGETRPAAPAPDVSALDTSVAPRTDFLGLLHTRFRNADAFKRVLHLIGASTEPSAVDDDGITHFEWIGTHVDLVTCNNPLTGELCDLSCASYVGIRADSSEHTKKVYDAIQRNKNSTISEELRQMRSEKLRDDGSGDDGSGDGESSDGESSDGESSDGESSDGESSGSSSGSGDESSDH